MLLGHLGARGDCLYATAIARQIKQDFPGCHLTWAVGSMCRAIVEGNPYVDEIWEFPMRDHSEMESAWVSFREQAGRRLWAGEFDEVFLTQIYPDNFRRFDGTVRASIFRGYPRPITVPVTPVVRLSESEVHRVRQFAHEHHLRPYQKVILFEYSGASGQTFVDLSFAKQAAEMIIKRVPGARIILASHSPVQSHDPNIIDGSSLSFKECAELTKYCVLLIGCSSGLTWLCTSDWAKPLPTIQLLRKYTSVHASLVHDHERFGLPTDQIIEMTDCDREHLVNCVVTLFRDGLGQARAKFHETIAPDFQHYADTLRSAYRRSGLMAVLGSLLVTTTRYGLNRRLISAVGRVGLEVIGLVRPRSDVSCQSNKPSR